MSKKAITTIFIFDHKCGHFSKENIPHMYWTDYAVSLHAFCSILYFSVTVSPSFQQQKLLLK